VMYGSHKNDPKALIALARTCHGACRHEPERRINSIRAPALPPQSCEVIPKDILDLKRKLIGVPLINVRSIGETVTVGALDTVHLIFFLFEHSPLAATSAPRLTKGLRNDVPAQAIYRR
jgi:hypothetical protein